MSANGKDYDQTNDDLLDDMKERLGALQRLHGHFPDIEPLLNGSHRALTHSFNLKSTGDVHVSTAQRLLIQAAKAKGANLEPSNVADVRLGLNALKNKRI